MTKKFLIFLLLIPGLVFADEQTDFKIINGLFRDGAFAMAVDRLSAFIENYPDSSQLKEAKEMQIEASLAARMYTKVHQFSDAYMKEYCAESEETCFKASLYNAYAFYFENSFIDAETILATIDPSAKKQPDVLRLEYERLAGDVSFERNGFSKAVDHYNNFLTIRIDQEIRMKQAMCYYHLKKYSKARKIFTKLKEEGYSHSKLFRYLGLIYFGDEKYEEALSWFRQSDEQEDAFFEIHTLMKLNLQQEAYSRFMELVPLPELSTDDVEIFTLDELIKHRKLPEALNYFSKLKPEDNRKLLSLGFTLMNLMRKYHEAGELFKTIAHLSSSPHKAYYQAAEFFLSKLNNTEEASVLYDACIEKDPEGPYASLAMLNKIKCSLYFQQSEKALSLNSRFLDTYGPTSPVTDEAYFILGKLMLERGSYEDAVKSYENIITNYPESHLTEDALFYLSDAYFRLGMYQDALQASLKVTKEKYKADCTYISAMSLYMLEQFEASAASFGQLSEIMLSAVDHECYAYALSQSGKIEITEKLFGEQPDILFYSHILNGDPEKALKLATDMNIPDATRLFASASLTEDLDQKKACLLQAVELSEKDSIIQKKAIIELHSVCVELKDYSTYLEIYDEYIKNDPEGFHEAQAVMKKARKQREKGKISKAISLYKLSVDLYPDAPDNDEAYYFLFEYSKHKTNIYLEKIRDNYKDGQYFGLASYNLGLIYFQQKQYRKSIECFEDCLKVEDENITKLTFAIYYYLGVSYEKTGQTENALTYYSNYLSNIPEDITQIGERIRIALFFQKNDKPDAALNELNKILNYPEAIENKAEILFYIAECQEMKGDLKKALETYLNVTYLHSRELMWSSTARFKAAKICEQLEFYDDAIKLYQKIADAYKNEIQGEFARKKLEELQQKQQKN